MVTFVALLIIAGVILLVLAGLNVQSPRFAPQWLGLACLALAAFMPALQAAFR